MGMAMLGKETRDHKGSCRFNVSKEQLTDSELDSAASTFTLLHLDLPPYRR
jgi:hypothetical protein